MTLALSAVQFPHPGGEHDPWKVIRRRSDRPTNGRMGWNVGEHMRKFLEAAGEWRSEDAGGASLLRFWGEWEPPSDWHRLPDTADRGMPRFLHRAVWEDAPVGRHQNTDPLVLGGFYYSNCRQHLRRMMSLPGPMQRLDVGSVILFGSERRRERKWVLDTVFVVRDRRPLRPGDLEDLLAEDPLLGHAVLRPLYSGSQEDRDFVIYRGATFDEPVDGRFSFVPAILAEQGRFARPTLEIPRVNPQLGRASASIASGGKPVHEVWEQTRRQVLDAGLVLATTLRGPGSELNSMAAGLTAGIDREGC